MASSDLVLIHGLTDQQARFVERLAQHGEPGRAYLEAGFQVEDNQKEHFARRLLRHPKITTALHSEVGRLLATDGAIARSVAHDILNDTTVSAKIRADLAVKMLRLGGHVEPRGLPAADTARKTLTEMSLDELRGVASQLENEIAERAKLVGSAAPAQMPQQHADLAS